MAKAIRSLTKLLIGLVIFLGLPLLGWGITDLSGFFDHPARLIYAVVIVLLQIVVIIRYPDAGSTRDTGKKTGLVDRLTLLPLQIVPLALVIVGPWCDSHNTMVMEDSIIVRYAGVALFVVGFFGMHWAEAALGKYFSIYVTIQEGHQLVTQGIFRFIRHPRYLGIIVFTAGLACVFRSWLALMLVAVLALVLILRIRAEETMLHRQFGAEWEAYVKKSWRLVPFAY